MTPIHSPQLECCGGDTYRDWRDSDYNDNRGPVNFGPLTTIDKLAKSFRVPMSCCRRGVDEDSCREAANIDPGTSLIDSLSGNAVPRLIYTEVRITH